MSLVRSATPYGNRKLYSLNGTNDTSGLSTAIYNPEKHRIIYDTDSSSTESYNDPKYLLDSPTEELTHASTSSICAQGAPSYQLMAAQDTFKSSVVVMRDCGAYQPGFEPEYLESLGSEGVDYNEDSMRLKLQELERALLDDENDDVDEDEAMFGPTRGMEIDSSEWAPHHCIHNVQFHDSPKESTTSSDSYVSSISSNKEESLNTPKDVLFGCAAAISDGNIEEASTMINELRQRVSIQGEPAQRIAAYMVEALAARMAASGKGLYKALKCKEPPSLDRLSAMQVLFEVCPCFRFGFMTANGAIIDAFKNEKTVHIIDFDINQGSQYITLLQTVASRPGKPPFLRLTGVDDPDSVQRPVGGLNLIGQRLEQLAKALELPFEFQAVGAKTEAVSPAMLDCRPGEALLVNFAFQLHHIPDESVSTVNQRDHLLRMVKSLNPKLVTVVEQDVNTNTAPFLPRFVEAYNYYSAVFESLDATLPRNSQDRLNVEKQCLARDIVNIVACEGEERIERYEVAGKWRARMMMAGFDSCPTSPSVNGSIRELIKKYSDRYKVREEIGALHFGWEDRVLIVASAWR